MTNLEKESKLVQRLLDTIGTSFVGKKNVVRKMVAAALANGHVLFEDYPGLGKTLLVKSFAKSLGVRFHRVQFTPDILPSDILGTKIWDQRVSNFKLSRGPIFTNILLADEINRAPPKTQSALLEAMEERQVTIEGETLRLEEPFFVLATQNPIEQEGSLALDESVYLDGQLRTGRELLQRAGVEVAADRRGLKLYDIGAWTYSLGSDGTLGRHDCLLYTLPYKDDFLTITTRTGRRIRVTKNHPLLVNESGSIVWKKAEELAPGDHLVEPARLPDPPEPEFPSHASTLARMTQAAVPREIPLDEDFAFWIAFVLSDGFIGTKCVEAVQKNYPEALDRWIRISEAYGYRVGIQERNGVRHARIYSKPLIEYLRLRFGVHGGKDKEVPTHFVALSPSMNREFLKAFICLESSIDTTRITFTQKSERNVNVVSHMLLREGIRSWIRHDGRVWRLKIQGEDAIKFLRQIGWIEPTKAGLVSLDRVVRSSFRVVPVKREAILRMVKVLGFNSFRTLPGRRDITKQSWYGTYRGLKDGERVMAEGALRDFNRSMRKEIEARRDASFQALADSNPRAFAAAFGLPMTQVADELSISKNQVWSLYSKGRSQQAPLILDHLRSRAAQRLAEAEEILAYLDGLVSGDVFYDPVRRIEPTPSDGYAFGLTVPGPQNYVAGLGACGINHNTYPLPEAQLDRFLLKLSTGYPENEQLEAEILSRRIGWQKDDPTQDMKPLLSSEAFRLLQQRVERDVFIHKDLLLYISKLVRGLRAHPKVDVGPSPRGALALLKVARSSALMNSRDYVTPDDVKMFVVDALAHRTILSVEHVLDGLGSSDVVREVLAQVPVPTRFLETQQA